MVSWFALEAGIVDLVEEVLVVGVVREKSGLVGGGVDAGMDCSW